MSDKNVIKLTKKQQKANAFKMRKKGKLNHLQQSEPIPFPEEEEEELNLNHNHQIKSDKKRKRDDNDTTTTTIDNQKDQEIVDNDVMKEDKSLGAAAKRRKRKKASEIKKLENNNRSSKLILFVGNLPFDITTDQLKSFFFEHCNETPEVRLLTPKTNTINDNKKQTKGCGFIEFKTSIALQKALRLHLTPISSNQIEEGNHQNLKKFRKINIELTAGGGGKNENRLKKLKLSKDRLNLQRDKILTKKLKLATEQRNKYGLVTNDDQDDIRVEFGSKKIKKKDADNNNNNNNNKADWGPKSYNSNSNHFKTGSSRFNFKPQTSGSNSIRLG
ncbi:hypothetical protein CROQUDRAFT_674390 [Cronartium quercuum f. sp. fusiforme G11]|uniref:RRM domain-containing protein n=1 Tax=Cronartium quercuum f. sp. fusiforme G11 TaxID=708437 RepID=A0A9P6T6V0_9BASI|nr:hypothetical protein CROQUDRAFT_674390 [Cronartium quercuum f. sp. fusiforme G11]